MSFTILLLPLRRQLNMYHIQQCKRLPPVVTMSLIAYLKNVLLPMVVQYLLHHLPPAFSLKKHLFSFVHQREKLVQYTLNIQETVFFRKFAVFNARPTVKGNFAMFT